MVVTDLVSMSETASEKWRWDGADAASTMLCAMHGCVEFLGQPRPPRR